MAGLWILDRLAREGGSAVLVERNALGAGQTVASQGILHGGVKYAFGGARSAARAASEALERWRPSLAGEGLPNLRAVRRRGDHCHLWDTGSVAARWTSLAARSLLRTQPEILAGDERPEILADHPGAVARIAEPVLDPCSLVEELARPHRGRIADTGGRDVEFTIARSGFVKRVRLARPESPESLVLEPRWVVLAAGAGNADLRRCVGLSASSMQRRPLHMVLVRGPLPTLNGHALGGGGPLVTITSQPVGADASVWQIGGRLAEDGVDLDARQLVRRAHGDLVRVLPRLDLRGLAWSTYRVDRAEAQRRGRNRPDDVALVVEGNVVTTWPTKLVLAPRLADRVADVVGRGEHDVDDAALDGWPRPDVAPPPWRSPRAWSHVAENGRVVEGGRE